VDAIGPGVTGIARGDRVFGAVLKPREGSFAEYVNVPRASLSFLPDAVTLREGGALALAGTAAWRAVEAARLQRGETVLIAGATGGIRLLAVQLAAQAETWVVASAHGDQARRLLAGLGAATIVDRRHVGVQVLEQHPGGVDVVLHFAGAMNDLLPLVRPGGRILSTVRSASDMRLGTGVTIRTVSTAPTPAVLGKLAEALACGQICVPIQRTYSLDETAAALHDFPHSKRGKLVLLMDGWSSVEEA
jgi:NADPH:quinone reductase-like Zn-dependent oxidoreductase